MVTAIVAGLAAASSASAAAPPACTTSFSRDIDSYVLFAYSDLIYKGANGPNGGTIDGGNIGVNYDNGSSSRELTMPGKAVFTTAGQQIVANKMSSGNNSSELPDVYTNDYSGTIDDSIIFGCGPTSLAGFGGLPIIATGDLPQMPVFSPGATDVTVANGGSLTLPPGEYKNLRVNDNGVLNLSDGIYTFAQFDLGKGVTINVTDGTEVRIAEFFSTNDKLQIIGSENAEFIVRSDGVGAGLSVAFAHQAIAIHGQFFVPNGHIDLGGGGELFGRYVADEISGDPGNNITYKCNPGPGEDSNCNPVCVPKAGEDENCNPIPCTPTAGQDANCKPIPCTPTAGQDANCQPVKTSGCVPKAGQDKNCNAIDSARLRGPSGCTTVYNVRVSGTNISKVVYKIDGKTVKTVKRAPFTYKLKSYKYKVGAHKLKATTYFKSGKTKTQVTTFQHCAKGSVNPKFTG
jgi:hypothetical protein